MKIKGYQEIETYITQTLAALKVGVSRGTIQHWEKRGWLKAYKDVAPIDGQVGRPPKLYKETDVMRVAKERGRTVR